MADKKITELTELTTADSADVILVVDVSDTTDATTGTTKHIKIANIRPTLFLLDEDIEAASDALSTSQCYGGLINNYGQTDNATLTLLAAATGMNFIVALGTTVAKYFRLEPNANDYIILDGTAGADGKYVGIASAVAGAMIQFIAIQTGASEWNWCATTISGAWAAE